MIKKILPPIVLAMLVAACTDEELTLTPEVVKMRQFYFQKDLEYNVTR